MLMHTHHRVPASDVVHLPPRAGLSSFRSGGGTCKPVSLVSKMSRDFWLLSCYLRVADYVAPHPDGAHFGEREVSVGELMRLPCNLAGRPRPLVLWYKDGEQIEERAHPRYD